MSKSTFEQLNIDAALLPTLSDLGYEQPSPIQEMSIPVLLEGKDLTAQAQTGTGKTAAFALPILSKLTLKDCSPQALVLAPTRELAIQVAEAFKSYAKHLKGFYVLPIYGGQEYRGQLKALKRGVHVIVGTPGRTMDHIERGTLVLDNLKTVVLDEADEMLNMGFIEDIKWILKQISGKHQTALFSATMPIAIKRIAEQYLNKPTHIKAQAKSITVESITQEYMFVAGKFKLEALTRYLEMEDFSAIIIFTKTKLMSAELAEKLEARGYSVAAINGDMRQSQREKVIDRIKKGQIDIIVATDVAARGLDVPRISHVVNYDIPYDAESYVHRIGRTGRAGRKGKALLFVSQRELGILKEIERSNKQTIQKVDVPQSSQLNKKREKDFIDTVINALKKPDLASYRKSITELTQKHGYKEIDIAAALASLLQKDEPISDMDIDFEPRHEREEQRRRRRPPRHARKPQEKKYARSGSKPPRKKGPKLDKGKTKRPPQRKR